MKSQVIFIIYQRHANQITPLPRSTLPSCRSPVCSIAAAASFSERKYILSELLKKSFVNKAFIFYGWNRGNEFAIWSPLLRLCFLRDFSTNFSAIIWDEFPLLFGVFPHLFILKVSTFSIIIRASCYRVNYHPSITNLNQCYSLTILFLFKLFSILLFVVYSSAT